MGLADLGNYTFISCPLYLLIHCGSAQHIVVFLARIPGEGGACTSERGQFSKMGLQGLSWLPRGSLPRPI